MRVEQNYDHQTYEDLYGNRGTFAHNPRMCLKGYTFHRRVYGPYRLKGPLMRKGWKVKPFKHMRGLCANVPRLP